MISSALLQAIQEVRGYQEKMPGTYDGLKLDLDLLVAEMDRIRFVLAQNKQETKEAKE